MPHPSNFAFLREHDEQLVRLGMLAERYFADDPNTCLLKLRQFAEVLAQTTATYAGLYLKPEESQYDLLSRLRDNNLLPYEIFQLFGEVRRTGNSANHAFVGDHRSALGSLRLAWQLAVWFHRTFKDAKFSSGPFIPPQPPKDESAELRAELGKLAQALAEHQAAHQEKAKEAETLAAQLRASQEDQALWERLAIETDAEKAKLEVELAQRLAARQAETVQQPAATLDALVTAANSAAQKVELDEADTRRLIDEQLRQAGWEADSVNLRYSQGTRPQKGRNLAIAEWPCGSGRADYVLFIGLTPFAAVEAKRQTQAIPASLQQAKRYSRSFEPSAETDVHPENWGREGEFRLPFVFATNGRPYLRQLLEHSGIWFADLRRPENLSQALQGWFTPEGLADLLKRDSQAAHAKLATEGFNYGFTPHDFQKRAILATEAAIARGQRELLLAMATGTGKTKTCIALVYRLLKTGRFRRILFLVDRSALGEQAANAFKDTRMEGLQSFANIFGIKELDEIVPDTETAVHLATIQGMVKRVLHPAEGVPPPAIDTYDCIVVDECHRGYLLDRELSDTELTFRDFDDYVSQYRRVLDYFAAVKIGLTATPALHTTEIFGPPVFTYTYREAVLDGFLVDHEPPIQIATMLSEDGIGWQQGAEIPVYDPRTAQIELFRTPDELHFDIEEFNSRVITEPFNRVVCTYLASELDPESPRKTLIFCANNTHADLVVRLLKEAFRERYGSVDDDAVLKITGKADQPLKLIRRYKNERQPSVAVTVDLLTTGIDVPAICQLVFLRRVGSRILFDQMLGRATRLCPDIGKETFRIYDAVRLYEALAQITAMAPVVVNPNLSYAQLIREITQAATPEIALLARDQLVAKLQRKKRHLSDAALGDIETTTGQGVEQLIHTIRQLPVDQLGPWLTARPGLGPILDRPSDSPGTPVLISDHDDRFIFAQPNYGNAARPEDYLQAFRNFINQQGNEIPALRTVVTRPGELTRSELRKLLLALAQAGFDETTLNHAHRQLTNQEMAASVMGHIRQAALGCPLRPFDERVDQALQRLLASRPWTTPQRDWLKKIAAQTKSLHLKLVDRETIEEPTLLFKREGGGFHRLDRLFDGQLAHVLATFNESVWRDPA